MKIQHIVLLKCRENLTDNDFALVLNDLKAARALIPGITEVSGGDNNSPEGIASGYTHAFVIVFEDEAARAAYLPHPEHKKIQAKIASILADEPSNVLVFDYSA